MLSDFLDADPLKVWSGRIREDILFLISYTLIIQFIIIREYNPNELNFINIW